MRVCKQRYFAAATYTVVPGEGATVQFIGSGGRFIAQRTVEAGEPASYTLAGWKGYVRARMTNKAGKTAWMPAVRVHVPASEENATRPRNEEPPPG